MPHLLIMNCPYCGSSDIAETSRVEGPEVESVWVFCLTCDEECVINRKLDDDDEQE